MPRILALLRRAPHLPFTLDAAKPSARPSFVTRIIATRFFFVGDRQTSDPIARSLVRHGMRVASLRLAVLAALPALAVLALAAPTCADTPESAARRRPPLPPPTIVQPVPAFEVELVDHEMRSLPAFMHRGQRFVMGQMGQRYRIHITNPTSARMEVVVSVDGLDAVDGREASLEKRGYVVPAFGDVTIDGFRTSMDSVAAFRFGAVEDSYAARTGSDRNVGVIGVAFFRERAREWRPIPRPLSPPSAGARKAPDAAPSTAPAPAQRRATKEESADRSGLGTQFGEQRDSHVRETTFERAAGGPAQLVQLRYDDREGLRAMGVMVPPDRVARRDERELRETADPFPGNRFAQPPPR
jgi:hypothetical protein